MNGSRFGWAVLIVFCSLGGLAFAQSAAECQQAYKNEVKQSNELFSAESRGCHRNSSCIAEANKQKAKRIKASGKKLKECRKAASKEGSKPAPPPAEGPPSEGPGTGPA